MNWPLGNLQFPDDSFYVTVYLLANLLQRPVVVLCGTSDIVSTEEQLGGIYLPFEHEPEETTKYPILLGYSNKKFHFAPLVTATPPKPTTATTPVSQQQSVPLTDAALKLLPVPFAVLPAEDWALDGEDGGGDVEGLGTEERVQELAKYLHAANVQFSSGGGDVTQGKQTIAVKMNTSNKPTGYEELLKNYVKGAKSRFKSVKKNMKCATNKCKKMPSSQLDGVCYKCYNKSSE